MDSLVADYGSSSEDEADKQVLSNDVHKFLKNFDNDSDVLRAGLFGCTTEIDSEDDSELKDVSLGDGASADEQTDGELKLPKPSFNSTWDELSGVDSGVSVFTNPFKAAEEAQKSLLEKHVKMTSAPRQTQTINGKQVCWNYRKGRCRFGPSCKFAHDSDLPAPVKKAEMERFEKPLESPHTIIRQPQHHSNTSVTSLDESSGDCDNNTQSTKKRKCGLGDGLIPSKKVLKAYHKQYKEI